MRKRTILALALLLALAACALADPTITSTVYTTSSTGMRSMHMLNALDRRSQHIVTTPSHDVLVNYQRGTGAAFHIVKTSNWGTSFVADSAASAVFANSTTAWIGYSLAQFGDTIFALHSAQTSTTGDSCFVRRYERTTQQAVDTPSFFTATASGGRARVGYVGNKLLYFNTFENGSTDSMGVYLSSGTTPPMTWSRMWLVAMSTKWSVNPACFLVNAPSVKGVLVQLAAETEDIYIADSARGDTVNTSFLPWDFPASPTALDWGRISIAPVNESSFAVAMQCDTANNGDSVAVREFYLTGLSGASGTATQNTSVGVIPASLIRNGHASFAAISKLSGTDTLVLSARTWADTSRNDSVDVQIWISGDNGATWSGPFKVMSGIVNRKCWNMQVAQTLYRNGDTIKYAAVFQDSASGTASDTGSILLANIYTAPPSGPDTLTTLVADSLHCDFSAEQDSIQARFQSPVATGYDSTIFAFSTSGSPDSAAANRIAIPYVANTLDTVWTVITATETDTVHVSAWNRDGDLWSTRKTATVILQAATLPPYTLLKRKKG